MAIEEVDEEKQERVSRLLKKAGFQAVSIRGKEVQCGCPFAPFTSIHKSDVDKHPSMGLAVRFDGPTKINCFTCGWKSGDKQQGISTLFTALAAEDSFFAQFVEEAVSIETPDVDEIAYLVNQLEFGVKKTRRVQAFDEADYIVYSGAYPDYLADRGIGPKTAKKWEAGWDEYRKRVTFPVRNLEGTLVGCVGRTVEKIKRVKYLNYWGFDKAYCLFGLQFCLPNRATVVVEGPFDAIGASRYLKDYNIVSPMGSSLSKWQIDTLVEISSSVILLSDNDDAGMKLRYQAVPELCRRVPTFNAFYSSAEDPFELGRDVVDIVLSASEAYWHRRK
jgi:5S rRNA maturation endonuclease (ribonuclease M5)